jgi:hypothetical protein
VDTDLDKLFTDKLEFQKPKFPITFGRISRGAHLFVLFPQKIPPPTAHNHSTANTSHTANVFTLSDVKEFSFSSTTFKTTTTATSGKIVKEKSMNLINFDDDEMTCSAPVNKENVGVTSISMTRRVSAGLTTIDLPSPTRDYWLSNKYVTTEHLLTILSISNLFMNLQNFIDLHSRKE